MIKLTQEKVKDVLAYMEDDLPNCLYLYGDIVRYGIDDPNMTVWFSEKNGKINAVVMKYFSGSHVYSKHLDFDPDELAAHLKNINVDRISSQRALIEMLSPLMGDEYSTRFGAVFRLLSYRKMKKDSLAIERASAEDVGEIAAFLMTNEEVAGRYNQEKLEAELMDRIVTGVGRSYVIRVNGEIVAHDSVTLETDRYMVAGLALVRDDYRAAFYGSLLESFMINEVHEEGKELYCMIVDGPRQEGFVRLGNQVVARYGKFVRRTI